MKSKEIDSGSIVADSYLHSSHRCCIIWRHLGFLRWLSGGKYQMARFLTPRGSFWSSRREWSWTFEADSPSKSVLGLYCSKMRQIFLSSSCCKVYLPWWQPISSAPWRCHICKNILYLHWHSARNKNTNLWKQRQYSIRNSSDDIHFETKSHSWC